MTVSPIEANQWAMMRSLAASDDAVVHEDDEVLWVATGVPAYPFNAVLRATLDAGTTDAAIDRAVAALDRRGVPWGWVVGPSSSPEDLEERLAARGFAPAEELTGMDAPIADVSADIAGGLRFERVRDEPSLEGFSTVANLAFGMPPAVAEPFLRLLGDLSGGALLQQFLALENGKPVACGSLAVAEGVAGLYNIAVAPDRQRGGARPGDDGGVDGRGAGGRRRHRGAVVDARRASPVPEPRLHGALRAARLGRPGVDAATAYAPGVVQLPKYVVAVAAVVVVAPSATIALLASGEAREPEGERIGRSVEGRSITVTRVGDPEAPRRALVVGCLHGDECAARTVADRLVGDGRAPRGTELLVVRDLNPDGSRRGTRANARGVDLNRNSGERWRRLRRALNSGRGPWSEPESRAIRDLIRRERPAMTVWYHQPLAAVDVPESGSRRLSRCYARRTDLKLRDLRPRPGSLSRWQNAKVAAGTSFVVELRRGRLSAADARRHAAAVLACATG